MQLRELQVGQNLYGVKSQSEVYSSPARDVAVAFKEFWSGVMSKPRKPVEHCRQWMERMPIPQRIRKVLPLFMSEVSESAIQVALKRMKQGSSLRLDGMPVEVNAAFPELFVVLALQNVPWKCIAPTILVVIEDALQIIVPPVQKGFLNGRQMIHHIINARGPWQSSESFPPN